MLTAELRAAVETLGDEELDELMALAWVRRRANSPQFRAQLARIARATEAGEVVTKAEFLRLCEKRKARKRELTHAV